MAALSGFGNGTGTTQTQLGGLLEPGQHHPPGTTLRRLLLGELGRGGALEQLLRDAASRPRGRR